LLDAVSSQLTKEAGSISTSTQKRSPMEKRKCPRFPVMLPAVFFGERAGGGLAVDVSLEGCRVRSTVPMHKGQYLRIRIDLVGETVTADLAVVRWSSKEECGMELIRMAPDQQVRLRGLLELFAHPPACDVSAPDIDEAPGLVDGG
jgi:PilZ domain-containing protein